MKNYIPEDIIKNESNYKMEQFKFACISLAVFALLSVVCFAQQPDPEAEPANTELEEPALQNDKTLNARKYELFDAANFIHIYSEKLEKWQEEEFYNQNPELMKKIVDTEEKIFDRKLIYKDLTGLEYKNHENFFSWWEENADYMEWMPALSKFAVNEEAKANNTVLNKFKFVFDIDGAQYWSYMAQNRLKELGEQGEYVTGYVENKGSVRVKRSDMQQPIQKEKGYKDAVDFIINKKLVTAEDYLPLMALLTKVTGQEFEDYSAWVFWWDTNKANIKLNEEGTRIVVGK